MQVVAGGGVSHKLLQCACVYNTTTHISAVNRQRAFRRPTCWPRSSACVAVVAAAAFWRHAVRSVCSRPADSVGRTDGRLAAGPPMTPYVETIIIPESSRCRTRCPPVQLLLLHAARGLLRYATTRRAAADRRLLLRHYCPCLRRHHPLCPGRGWGEARPVRCRLAAEQTSDRKYARATATASVSVAGHQLSQRPSSRPTDLSCVVAHSSQGQRVSGGSSSSSSSTKFSRLSDALPLSPHHRRYIFTSVHWSRRFKFFCR